ncbi:galactose-1-phosphate uridyl transferase [Parachaetomium inaequale]|uniref:Galactose-1-phosphate uridylyltransferase n=1 Tax=Parachaetomium inaequale TaxID=2588326 RepID=A0AAN6PBQ0_9PEZI|nr:galactose-1-phosphate uridyl transferase [Parachaetomium inaequale]
MPDLSEVPHRRYNPLRDSWLLVSPHRIRRSWQGQHELPLVEELLEHDPKCYLCPGNLRVNGNRNPDYKSTFLFENDYHAVHMNLDGLAASLLRSQPVIGVCYVLAFSAKHNATFANLTQKEALGVIKAWTDLYARHHRQRACSFLSTAGNPGLKYMQIFENRGRLGGCSSPHPHCQIWVTSCLPEEPKNELTQMVLYQEKNSGRHLLEDYIRLELQSKERVVWRNETFLLLSPWWAVWPFEVLLVPTRHVRSLLDLDDAEKMHFVEAIQQVVDRYDGLFGFSFPYSSGLHQAPLDVSQAELDSSYLHMHFYPPLQHPSVRKFFGGYELLAEPSRDLTPEQAAELLRKASNGGNQPV